MKGREIEQSRSTGTDQQEVEWQFDSADLAPIERWLKSNHEDLGIFVESGEEKKLTDVYYDTADWKLYRAGYALRIRGLGPRRSEATLKSLASAATGDNARRRREISEPLRGEVPGALLSKKRLGLVGECIKALVGSRELRPLFEDIHAKVEVLYVVQDTAGNIQREGVGSRVGEATLDETEIPLGDEPVRFARVEVEAEVSGAEASLELLKEFAETIEKACGLRPATASKYELGLRAKGLLD